MTITAFWFIFAILVTNEAFINKLVFELFFCLTLSSLHRTIYSETEAPLSQPETPLTDFKPAILEEQVKIGALLPDAKLELMLILDPDISENIDTNYATIEFCRLFTEAQEVFDTFKDKKVTIEFSALYFEESEKDANYINDNVLDDNSTLNVLGAISDIADVVTNWTKKYDAYLLLTRRRLVAMTNESIITEYESGYSVTGGACSPSNNIAIAKYSFKNIMHQITDLLGAVHVGDNLSATCREGNYTYQVVGEDAFVHFEKGFSNCTKEFMKNFLKTEGASCLYSENILDNLDCDSIVPEIG